MQPLIVKITSEVSGAVAGFKRVETGLKQIPAAAAAASGGIRALAASLAPMLASFAAFAAIGIAAKAIQELVQSLKSAAPAFTALDSIAGNFSNTLKRIKKEADDLKSSLDFSTTIEKLRNTLQFGEGGATDILNIKAENKNLETFINLTEGKVKKLKNTLSAVDARIISGSAIDQAKKVFGGIADIPKDIINNFSEIDQAIIKGYQDASDKLEKLEDQRLAAGQKIAENQLKSQIKINEESKRLTKERIEEEQRLWESTIGAIKEPAKIKTIVIPVKLGEPEKTGIDAYLSTLSDRISNAFDLSKPIKGIRELQNNFKELQDTTIEKFQAISELAGMVGDSFANAFSEIAQGQNVFTALGNAVKRLILDLAQAVIKAMILRAVMSAFGFGGAAGGDKIGGFLLNAAGRAQGGPVTRGTPYLIGERGPELFIPGSSGSVIPNSNLSSIRGGAAQMVSVMVTGRLSGRDILLSGAREGRYQGRNV